MSALKGASGGETILLRPGVQYTADLSNVNPGGKVVVTSLDADRPANISGLELSNVSNVTFDNLLFEFHGKRAPNQMDVKVRGGEDVAFVNSTFRGPADGFAHVGDKTPNMMHVSGTRDFTFGNNDISGFKHGLALHRSTNVEIEGNDLHHMQGDGMRFSQVKNIEIEGNRFHDFFGGDQAVTHNDYIQFWTTNTTAPSENIVIRGNVMMSGKFQSQAIFIRDQMGDTGKGEMRYQNMLIEENVIYNNHHHGITAPATDGLIIRGNTLIVHPVEGRHTTSINVADSTGVQIYDNVAPRMTLKGSNDIVRNDGNILYLDKPGFLDRNFVNTDAGVGAELSDLRVDPNGDLVKSNGTVYGSEMLRPSGSGQPAPVGAAHPAYFLSGMDSAYPTHRR